jgi:hypothetical protein
MAVTTAASLTEGTMPNLEPVGAEARRPLSRTDALHGASGPQDSPNQSNYSFTTLDPVPGDTSPIPTAVNNLNSSGQVQVTGYSKGVSSTHALIWQNSIMTDLNALIPGGTGWVLGQANGINRAGQVVGIGNKGGFLLTPTTAAATIQATP